MKSRVHEMKNYIQAMVLLAVAILCGCGGKNELVGGGQGNSVYLTSISMTPVNPTVSLTVPPQAPSTAQFVVIGKYNVGNPKEITDQMTWTSLDTKVATIDGKGTATAADSGRVVIVGEIFEPATQKMLHAQTVLTVVPQLTAITVNPASAKIASHTVQQITAVGKYNDGTQVDVTALAGWSSSQPSAATVSSSPGTQGRVTGVAPGTADITASFGSLSASTKLAVSGAKVVSLAVTPANPSIPLSGGQQFAAMGTFDDGSSQDLTSTVSWESSNKSVVRVTTTGTATGVGVGSADVRASFDALSEAAATAVVATTVKKIVLVPVSKIANGTRVQIRAAALLQDGGMIDVTQIPGITWSSSNTGVATVVADGGLVTAVGTGRATIAAKVGDQTGSTTLSVSDATIQSIAIAPDQAGIAPGTAQNMIALATFHDEAGKFQQDVSNSATWSSDNTAVATVSFAHGFQEVATAAGPGSAHVSASFSDSHGNTAASSVALSVSTATLNGISVAPGSPSVITGGGQQLIATGTFSDGTTQDLTLAANWSTTDDGVAEITPLGLAWAHGPGQTSVSATIGADSGSSGVLVNPGALVRIDVCAATIADPLNNCPPLDPVPPPPPVMFPKSVPYGLVAIGTFADGSREDLTGSVRWTSSDATVAAISNEPGVPGIVTGIPDRGCVTGLSGGHVVVSASAAGMSGSLAVTVTEATPQFLTVTPANGSTPIGFPQQMKAVATFSDGSNIDVTRFAYWSTSDASSVIVSATGLAYPSGLGTATITASVGSTAGYTTLTVQ